MSAGEASQKPVLLANHTALIAGAERSLLDLLAGLSAQIETVVACPPGELSAAVEQRGGRHAAIPEIDASFRAHPVHTPRGIAQISRVALRLRRLARRLDAPLLHANTERAGLAAVLARRLGGPPVLVHVRGRLPGGRLSAATRRAIESGADAVVANSRYTAAQLPRLAARDGIEIVHNPVDCDLFDPGRIDRAAARARLGLDPGDVVLAVVGYLIPWKGQDDAIRILARLKPAHPRIRLLVAGSAKFDAPSARLDSADYANGLRTLARELGVQPEVRFLGERDDVPELLRAADLLLVPSWHEPFGRVVLEGMAMRLPVVATSEGGPAEVLRDGVDGMLLGPRQPERWAETVAELLTRPGLASALGERARDRVLAEFTIEQHAARMIGIYNGLIDASS